MLNENLKLEMIVHLNGKMLHDNPLFQNFDIFFISELTYLLKRETYSIDDNIFIEDDPGPLLYYITLGNVILVQKKSYTFIKELG